MIWAQMLLVELAFVILPGNCKAAVTPGARMHYQLVLKPNHWNYLCSREAPVFVEHLVLSTPIISQIVHTNTN